MATYLSEIDFNEEFPTAKELAKRLARDYGIVTYHGTPHTSFVRSFLDMDIKLHHKQKLMTTTTPRAYVYQNADVLLDFIENILPELENNKAISISIHDKVSGKGMMKTWRLFWKPALPVRRNKVVSLFMPRKYIYDDGLREIA